MTGEQRTRQAGWPPAMVARAFAVTLLFAWVAAVHAAEPCAPAFARVVSVQGNVELRRPGANWQAAELNSTLCAGDMVRVHQRSRAALLLSNETTLRLDQGTALTLLAPDDRKATLLELISGGLLAVTRTPRPFKIKTPFVNANVEGTEFAVRVEENNASITVYEGQVVAENDAGSAALASGEAAAATRNAAPTKGLVIRPTDAVAWTLYFPSVFDYRLDAGVAGSPGEAVRLRSIDLYRRGQIAEALAELENERTGVADARFLTYRAGLLLLVGRLDEAKPEIERALRADSNYSDAHALLAIIAVAENDTDKALESARRAVSLDPISPGGLIALSYAQQARFEIEPALASVREAVRLDPRSALAYARLAELEMSTGNLDGALAAAQEAVKLNPNVGRTQTVLGFANLVRIDTQAAKMSFERAIELDSADPLPRLGLGLAKIREGALAAGRVEIEIATILDPRNSLVRSYLGKAYYEEKRDALAGGQFAVAKNEDPKDPTPYLYEAVLQQAANRPVQALQDFGTSIALNDNRAVYRSRLLLDQDLAARSVRLAYAYRELGFEQLGTLEALKALSLDPTDAAAHRFLADSYVGLIRSEAARVSELLQAQLRQPLGLNSLQPQSLRFQQFIDEGTGPARSGGYELSPLFTRDQVAVKFDAMTGSKSASGDQLFVSGLRGSVAYSLGQYHFETQGLRPNNDLRRDLYTAFLHIAISPSLRVQAELRDDFTKQGDLSALFDTDNFSPTIRDEFRLRTFRLGGVLALDARSDLVLSATAGTGKERIFDTHDPAGALEDRERIRGTEIQYAFKSSAFHVLAGLSYYDNKAVLQDPLSEVNLDTRESNAYSFVTFTGLPWGLRPQLGLSSDTYSEPSRHLSRVNPKLGLLWSLPSGTTIRAAAFRALKRTVIANQTLQPAQVFGFNQFFDGDPNGTISRRYGLAVDHKASSTAFLGAEWSSRDLRVPGFPGDPDFRWTEGTARLYAYYILNARVTATAEYQLERFRRPEENTGNEGFTDLRTALVPLGLRFHDLGRWSATVKATRVSQKLRHLDRNSSFVHGNESVVLADLNLAYHLARRGGTISMEARNLFDKKFRYQEVDIFSSPRFFPRRLVFMRLSLVF